MAQAEEAQAEAKAALEKYNAQLAGARTEANEIREAAREQGASIVAEMRGQAQAEAARITEAAKRQVEAERQQAVVQLRQEVGTLSTDPREQDRRRVARGRGPPERHRRPLPRRARGRRGQAREGRPRGSGRLMRGSSRGAVEGGADRLRRALSPPAPAWHPRRGALRGDGRRRRQRLAASRPRGPVARGRPTSRAWPARSSAARSVRPPPASSRRSPASAGPPSATSATPSRASPSRRSSRRPSARAASTASRTSCSASSGSSPATPSCATPSRAATATARARPRSSTGCSRARPRPRPCASPSRRCAHPRGRRLDQVLGEYLDLAARRREELTALVTVAAPLTEQQQARLRSALEAHYSKAVTLQVVQDPRVMGGIRVQVGDEVVDGTVLRRLDEARRHVTGG